MNFSVRKVLNEIYSESLDFRKRKFDISKYQPYIEKFSPEEMLLIAFKEFPGNFARKFILITLKWWKPISYDTFIKVIDKLYDDELALVYLVSFAKRYFDLDLTHLCLDKDLYLQPISYFVHSNVWTLELERLNVDIQFIKSLKIQISSPQQN